MRHGRAPSGVRSAFAWAVHPHPVPTGRSTPCVDAPVASVKATRPARYDAAMTPAINLLKREKIAHTVRSYVHDAHAGSYGGEAVDKLGLDPAQVFKTLLASTETHELLVAIVPVAGQLDLKALAEAAGCRKCEMAPQMWHNAPPATWSVASARSGRRSACAPSWTPAGAAPPACQRRSPRTGSGTGTGRPAAPHRRPLRCHRQVSLMRWPWSAARIPRLDDAQADVLLQDLLSRDATRITDAARSVARLFSASSLDTLATHVDLIERSCERHRPGRHADQQPGTPRACNGYATGRRVRDACVRSTPATGSSIRVA